MPKHLTNFTPVIDEVNQAVGFVGALVYGVVWRYCQMSGKKCTASVDKIAARANCSTKTVRRHLAKLCEEKYLVDLTPNLRNKPHEYKLTDKVGVTTHTTGDSETESPGDEDERLDRESKSLGLRVQAYLDLESTEETLEETPKNISAPLDAPPLEESEPPQSKNPTQRKEYVCIVCPPKAECALCKGTGKTERSPKQQVRDAMNNALSHLCCEQPYADVSEQTKAMLGKQTTFHLGRGRTHVEMRAFYGWWYTHDYRGQGSAEKGYKPRPPLPREIKDEWGKFSVWWEKEREYREYVAQQEARQAEEQPENGTMPTDPQAAMREMLEV